MAFEGFISFGGNEIVNNSRAFGYARTAACPMAWFKRESCDTLADALGDLPYTADNLGAAPWYDLSQPDVSGRFFGVYALSIVGLNDSTRSAQTIEGVDDGGVVGRTRKGVRTVKIRAMLAADGRDALDYGIAWLNAALDPDACGQHGEGCGATDLEFLTDCPPERTAGETDAEYAARVEPYQRYLHGVGATSGPYERELMNSGRFWAQIFEWTFTAGRPWVYSVTRPVTLPVTPTIVVQDTPFNLVPHPSAELAGAAVTVATNYATNPSVETNDTGWAAERGGGAIAASAVTGSRSTEIAAVGAASYRVRMVASAAGVTGDIRASQVVALPLGATPRYSMNLWATANVEAGTAVIQKIQYLYVWLNASDVLISSGLMGELPPSGGPVFVASLQPPAGAAKVIVRAQATLTSWGATAVIRLYADALAVTVP